MADTKAVRPEVLAPAGDSESMRAAVRAGADAVYFGIQGFNARARATNFDASGLRETFQYLHAHEVRGYVTLNTLVFDDELPRLEDAIGLVAEANADAIIVQDLGVLRLARTIAKSLPIHASTQMTCTDAASVEFARELGASRVILARELSLEDIRAIRESTDVELEVFVHGALCIAYSGQCLTSEAIGGRSANRGACAQACRLPYELFVDGVKRDLGDKAYLLSPEDLEASALVPDLIRLGIRSLKIEGRLKGPEYVAATTRLYRSAIDHALLGMERPTEKARADALQMFSRGSGPGFLAGVNHQRLVEGRACDHRGLLVGRCSGKRIVRGKPYLVVDCASPLSRGDGVLVEGGYAGAGEVGGRVWGLVERGEDVDSIRGGGEVLIWLGPDKELPPDVLGRRMWKTNDPQLQKRIRATIESEPYRIPISFLLRGSIGERPVLEGQTERGVKARVLLDAPLEHAEHLPLSREAIREKLSRLGDTPFQSDQIVIDLPANVTLPISALNRARRALVEALLNPVHSPRSSLSRENSALLDPEPATPRRFSTQEPIPEGLFVLCRTLEQAHAALDAGARGVYLDFLELTGTGDALRALRERGAAYVGVAPPRIRKPGEEKIEKYLQALSPDAVLVRSLGALQDGATWSIPRIGDFSLNVANRIAAEEVLSHGLCAFTPSFDLDSNQLLSLLSGDLNRFAEVVVHHPMPLFHMEHCVIAAVLSNGTDHRSCGRPCEHHKLSLRDRAGMEHPVEADVGCRNTVFHAAAQSAADLVQKLQRAQVKRFRIELVRESGVETMRIVEAYQALLAERITPLALRSHLSADGRYGVVRGALRVLPS